VNGTNGAATAEVYQCDNGQCLNPAKVRIALDGYRKQVQTALDDIRIQLSAEKSGGAAVLSAGTRKLIGISRIPVLTMMTTAVALGPSVGLQVENELVEPVAFDMVATYLDWAYKAATDSARQMAATVPGQVFNAYMAGVDARNREYREITKNKNFMSAMQIIQKARFLDQVLISNLTPHFQQVFQYARSH